MGLTYAGIRPRMTGNGNWPEKLCRPIAESVTRGRKSGAEMAWLHRVGEPAAARIVRAHRQQQGDIT